MFQKEKIKKMGSYTDLRVQIHKAPSLSPEKVLATFMDHPNTKPFFSFFLFFSDFFFYLGG